MSSNSSTATPLIGADVNYVGRENTDNSLRRAIVVGRAAWNADELHLAVLTDTGADLDLLSLAVPPDPTGVSAGTWHQPPAAAWPAEDDVETAEAS